MVATKTNLPVIGVPVESKALKGLDSLLSIAQMPAGVPVATMAIGGAANAALFAARILALGDAAARGETRRTGREDCGRGRIDDTVIRAADSRRAGRRRGAGRAARLLLRRGARDGRGLGRAREETGGGCSPRCARRCARSAICPSCRFKPRRLRLSGATRPPRASPGWSRGTTSRSGAGARPATASTNAFICGAVALVLAALDRLALAAAVQLEAAEVVERGRDAAAEDLDPLLRHLRSCPRPSRGACATAPLAKRMVTAMVSLLSMPASGGVCATAWHASTGRERASSIAQVDEVAALAEQAAAAVLRVVQPVVVRAAAPAFTRIASTRSSRPVAERSCSRSHERREAAVEADHQQRVRASAPPRPRASCSASARAASRRSTALPARERARRELGVRSRAASR